MDKAKRNLILELAAFFCGLIVVAISASTMAGVQSKAQLIGLIAGSFGSGAALVSAIRDHATRHGGKEAPGGGRTFRILFVCVENSSRSQMAEAFAKIHGAGLVDAWSAGSKPSGTVNPRAIAAMRERGYDLAGHRSKGLAEFRAGRWDRVVTMGCGDACPWVPAERREDWELPDPHALSSDEFNELRDEIERRVIDLIARLRAGSA